MGGSGNDFTVADPAVLDSAANDCDGRFSQLHGVNPQLALGPSASRLGPRQVIPPTERVLLGRKTGVCDQPQFLLDFANKTFSKAFGNPAMTADEIEGLPTGIPLQEMPKVIGVALVDEGERAL
jgi:hypothetical protein